MSWVGSVMEMRDRFNRQLHQADKDLAKKVAAASNGKYTEQQVEDQMRLSDVVNMNGQVVESGKADEINAATTAITDTGAKWLPVPGTTNIVQDLPQPDPDIIALIVSVQKQTTGDVPYTTRQDYSNVPIVTNTPPAMPTARCGGAQADCAAGLPAPTSDATFNARRTDVANTASYLATQAGRVAAAATAAGSVPGPHVLAADVTAVAASAANVALTAIQQVASPNPGGLAADTVSAGLGEAANALPGYGKALAPVVNELLELGKNSAVSSAAQKQLNGALAK